MHKHLTFTSLDAFTFQLVHSLSALLQNMFDSVPANKEFQPFEGKEFLLFFCLGCFCLFFFLCRVNLNANDVAL